MAKVKDIEAYFQKLIPSEMKMDFDNVGLLAGCVDDDVKRVLVALDACGRVIDEAVEKDAQLVLTHHPVFFETKAVSDKSIEGKNIIKLIKNGIAAICLHTNLDAVDGGVNDALAKAAGVKVQGRLDNFTMADGREYGIGRYGDLEKPMSMAEYLPVIKKSLDSFGLRYYDAGRPVHKLALCGGAGDNYIEKAALLGCDTLLTSDIKHHRFLEAEARGINLIDGGHFCTENVVIPLLADMLKKGFPQIEVLVSESSGQVARFF